MRNAPLSRDSVSAAAWSSPGQDRALLMRSQTNGGDTLPRTVVAVFGFSQSVSTLAMGLARDA